MSLKAKLYLSLSLLCCAMLLCWGVFYVQTMNTLTKTSHDTIAQAADRVNDTLESAFLSLEHAAVSLSSSNEVKAFLKEEEPLRYYEKSDPVRTILDSVYQPNGLVRDVLLYNMDGVFHRFRGELGNTAAHHIGYFLMQTELSGQTVLVLKGASYVAYVAGVYDQGEVLGYMVFLMGSEDLTELFRQYDASGSLMIGLAADDTIAASNRETLVGTALSDLTLRGGVPSVHQIGLTPFQLLVMDSGETQRDLQIFFTIMVLSTAALLLLMLCFFLRSLNRIFFRPVLGLMENAKQIGLSGNGGHLQHTGVAEFDLLVEQVNAMVDRLEEGSRALFQMQLDVQTAQLDRQRAMIVSLKKQINAHFTVNTLNVIKRLDEMGEREKVREMCDGLAYLLRYANGGEEFVGGLDEMFVLERYVDIMRIRYPGGFEAEFDVDDQMDAVQLPRMLVQPLVENAILHGLHGVRRGGKLTVTSRVEGEQLTVRVADNGCGIPPQRLEVLRTKLRDAHSQPWDEQGLEHIALPNVQKRVVSQYGEGYGLIVDSKQGYGTTVTLTLPAVIA